MNFAKRFAAAALTAVLTLGALPAFAAEGLTRGEAAELLISAAQDYNPGVRQSDVIRGYGEGALGLDDPLTRAQALVMLRRAFGILPAPESDNARTAYPAETFTDVPAWAAGELSDVLGAGIVAGTGSGLLSPDEPITVQSLDTLIRRVYALEGTNLKDDYYAAVNRDWLAGSDLPAGLTVNGPLYGLTLTVQNQINELIADIVAKPQQAGTPEAKIKALYDCVTDAEGREKAGVAPIQKYLDAIESAKTLRELTDAELRLRRELGLFTLLGFGLKTDAKDSSRCIVSFSALNATLGKNTYASDAAKDAYMRYIETLFTLSGLGEAQAKKYAGLVWDTEAALADASMDNQEQGDIDKTYNLYTMDELCALFPNVDLRAIYDVTGLKAADRIVVSDVGLLEANAALLNDAHLDTLKAISRCNLLMNVSGTLNQAFVEASYDLNKALLGIDSRISSEELAAAQVTAMLSTYLARAYVEHYFSPEAKADVEEMIREVISVYKERIQGLDWMSEETKARAIRKLDTMSLKVGYPNEWDSSLDSVELLSPAEGGSFFSNVIALQKAELEKMLSRQDSGVDKTAWPMSPYTVNACYNFFNNELIFPAAFLQAPLYDPNAPREANFGGLGYFIGHEISHAFDDNGAKFDENGNAADWWAPEDYAAFRQKCEAVTAFYDGVEVYPGIACSGALTLSENVADVSSLHCLMSVMKREGLTDYDTFFRAVARIWASTTTRQIRELLSGSDVHSPDKLRCNRALQTLDEFYETYDIQPGDGMWVDPAARVSVW